MSIATLRAHSNAENGDFKYGSKTPCAIHVHIIEAQNLMSADSNGFSDPYVKLGCANSEEKKTTGPRLNKTLDPVFDWMTTFNFKDATFPDVLKVKLYDYDRGSRNDPLGMCVIPLTDLCTLGAISGWFYLQSVKAAKKGEEVERSHGRVYIRIVGDKHMKAYEKANPEGFIQRRHSLLDLVRSVEFEANAATTSRIRFELTQAQKQTQRAQNGLASTPEDIPPPPPSPLDGLEAYKKIVYASRTELPVARLPDPLFHSQSPCFISSPLQHPRLPAVPIEFVSTAPMSKLQDLSIHSSVDEITNNDVNVPLVAYKLTLCCASWNVGNAPPSEAHLLKEWLREDCDVYVIGTQENHYQPRKQYKNHNEDFNSSILAALGQQYVLLQQEDMGEIHIHLIVKRSIKCYIDVMQAKKASEATGFIGVLPNKGGTAIAINILGTSFCFVSSHLAAHAHKKDKRDADMAEIVRGISFLGSFSQQSILNAFNHTFWVGDLNYRLKYAGEEQEPNAQKFEEMQKMIAEEDWDSLLATDQLLFDTIEKKTAFVGFNDCPIGFVPTFKVKKNQLLSYDPLRAPSYTDRVLYKSQQGFEKQVQFVSFHAAKCVTSSDHKPVSAIFNIYPSAPVTADHPCISDIKFTLTKLSIIGLSPRDSLLQSISSGSSSPIGNLITSIDPTVEFSSPVLKDTYKTPVKKATSMPTWPREELPVLQFQISSEGRLLETMTNILVFNGNAPTRSMIASGVLSFKGDDVIALLHHHHMAPGSVSTPLAPKSAPSSPSIPTSPTSPTSPPPLSPQPSLYRTTTSTNGLEELEIDRIIPLSNSSGQEAGVLRLSGFLQWTRKDRVPAFQVHNTTSMQGLRAFGK